MTRQELPRERGVTRHRIVAGVGRQITEEVVVVAEPLVGEACSPDRAGWIGRLVGVGGIDVRPEGIGMADELRLRILAEHRFESLETRGPEAFTLEVRYLLKVDENGHAQF